MTVVLGPEEPYRCNQLALRWATESKISRSVTILHQIWPIALVSGTVESESVRTFQYVTPTVVAVHETSAIGTISQFVVSKLVRAILGRNSGLGSCAAAAIYVDRVLTRVGEQIGFVVE